jgi:alpha-amylase
VITDRYALPQGADLTKCDPGKQTWCGGTWNTIRENLDYIEEAGFTAVWISPISQNWQGPRSAYGDPYHGYWIQDATKLNEKFGTADDLKALSAELHKRGMYLMVDVVVNNVMATSTTPDYSKYMFKDASQYHSYCPIEWGNRASEMDCWFGDEKVPLPDLNTENPSVIKGYGDWIQDLVKEYEIDGLRIDAAKHVDTKFWKTFCEKAGVFCMGEVFDSAVSSVAPYQGPLDSVLNYPMYQALVQAFQIPGPNNVTAIADVLAQSQQQYKDTTVLGNFLENQDLPRWSNISVDPQTLYNAMTFNFMTDGIPIVYYGQEQRFTGFHDPYNREALWPSGYNQTVPTYTLLKKLNKVRNHLLKTTKWATEKTQVLTTSPHGIALLKGSALTILTTVGSPPQEVAVASYTPFAPSTPTTDILTCKQYAVGSSGTIDVSYVMGGQPVVLVPNSMLYDSGICSSNVDVAHGGNRQTTSANTSASGALGHASVNGITFFFSLFVAFMGFSL